MTTEERNTELRWMSNPMTWPNMVLPIVKRTGLGDPGQPTTGLLTGGGPTVYFVNMWALGDPEYKGKAWSDLPHKTYESFEAIVDDGWRVD